MKTMFIKTNLKKALSVVMIVQLLFSTVFGVSYMTLGRTATDVTVVNGSTILQKAYCDNGDYYINVDPGSETTVQRLNMLLRYESGDTTIATGNFTYNSFLGRTITANTPRVVTTGDSGYEDLEGGYPYIKMEQSTASASYYLGAADFNFGDFFFTNNFGINASTLKFGYVLGNPTISATTIVGIAGGDNTLPDPYNYTLDVKFIPEPCEADQEGPIFSTQDATDTGSHLPGNVVDRANIYAGVKFGIKEPDYDGGPSQVTYENYVYTGGGAQENTVVDPLDTTYVVDVTNPGTSGTNQWGLNTGSIQIRLVYSGVASGAIDQRTSVTAEDIIFSGSDLEFDYDDDGVNPLRSWNRNYRGAMVSVKQSVLDAQQQFRKETTAYIMFTGQDRANSLPYVINRSGTDSRLGHNILQGGGGGSFDYNSARGYMFNEGAGGNAPTSAFGAYGNQDFSSSNSTPGSSTRIGATLQQISGSHNNIYFKFTDNRAGIDSGSITMQVDVFTATKQLQSSYETNYTTSDDAYIFSGSDLSLFGFAGNADYDDYTGYVTLTDGLTALTTGDRVRMVLYAEDYVGNSVTKTGWFDMQDYPPKPSNITVNIQLENNSQLTDFNVQSPSPNTTILSGYYSSYQSTNGAVWFTYSGQSVIELTGVNGLSTLTGILLNNGVLTGTAHVDTGLDSTTLFGAYPIIVTNIYGQTGLLNVNINVEPGCSDAEGCGPKLWIYTGTSLSEAEANYPLSGVWYNHWFVKIDSFNRPILTGDVNYAILYCADTGSNDSMEIQNLNHPTIQNSPNPIEIFSGSSTLYISGDASYGMSGIIYQSGVIYIFRDLTGSAEYDAPGITGGSEINWTRDALITGTITLTGGDLMSNDYGLTLSGVELGGGVIVYTYAVNTNTGFSIYFENRWNDITGGTVEPDFYQTGVFDFNVSWIDRQVSLVSGATSYQSPHTGTVTLTVTATGYGEDFTGNLTYTTDDDDKIILQAFTTGTDYTSFGDNQSSGVFIYDFDVNSGTWLTGIDISIIGNRSGYAHFIDKAGNTGYVYMEATGIQDATVTIYAIPGYRAVDNYDFTGNIQIFVITGAGGTGELYSTYTGSFNTAGTGSFVLSRPLYGQTIGVVLQTTMHLPVLGFTGVFTETGTTFWDLTAWTGLDAYNYSSGWFDRVDLSVPLGLRSLLVPGDVYKIGLNVTGSIINAFDMNVINQNLTLNSSTTHPEYDFNDQGGIISSFEQAVIIQNLQRQGWDLELDKFGGLIYVQ